MKRLVVGFLILSLFFSLQGCGSGDGSTDLAGLLEPREGDVAIPGSPASVNDVALTLGQESVIADGSSVVLVRATVLNLEGAPLAGITVNFTATAGTLSKDSEITDKEGRAAVFLAAPTKPAVAEIFADVSGFSRKGTISFIPGPPDPDKSIISVLPKSLPADGSSQTNVTVSLYDKYENPVANGTSVTLLSNGGGSIFTTALPPRTPQSNITTSGGVATFYYTAPQQAGTVTLSLAEFADITQTVNVGSLSSGEPSSIRISVSTPHLAVKGVGQLDLTTFKIEVLDDAGNFIDERRYENQLLNNLRVSFATHPKGGEYITGARSTQDSGGNPTKEFIDTRASGFIDIRTDGGSANLNLQSGTLPGSVELRIEALYDAHGVLLPPERRVVAALPLAVIASGPPHTIVLTTPISEAVENLGGGVYRRIGTAIVTDRYGNTVPDGTAIHLGLVDSVIASGQAVVNGTTLRADDEDIFNSTIIRNDYPRGIQANDRVMLMDFVPPQDKSRHVAFIANGSNLEVQTPYSIVDETERRFIVGASLIGGSISGTLERGNTDTLTPGTTLTRNGLADIFVTYPANASTIGVGCGWFPQVDIRHQPIGSARVFVVAESSADPGPLDLDPGVKFSDRATTIDEGRFCFAPIAGFGLEAIPSTLQLNNGASGDITLILEDGGGKIPLPFWPVGAFVEITASVEGSSFHLVASGCETNLLGRCDSTVTVSGATITGTYTAEITYIAGDARAKALVKVIVP